jgi:hypothetical protein
MYWWPVRTFPGEADENRNKPLSSAGLEPKILNKYTPNMKQGCRQAIRFPISVLNTVYFHLKSRLTWIIFKDSARTAQWAHRLGYKNQSVNVVQGNNRCLFWDPYKTHNTLCVGGVEFLILKQMVYTVTTAMYAVK